MAGNRQRIKLYWVFTKDHGEDWFVFATSASSARAFHDYYEGYGTGDARARLIVQDVHLTNFTNGDPPCHAQLRELMALGFENACSVPNQRSVRFEGNTYTEGILESTVEAGKKNLAATLRENGDHGCGDAPCSTAGPEDQTEAKRGLHLVH